MYVALITTTRELDLNIISPLFGELRVFTRTILMIVSKLKEENHYYESFLFEKNESLYIHFIHIDR